MTNTRLTLLLRGWVKYVKKGVCRCQAVFGLSEFRVCWLYLLGGLYGPLLYYHIPVGGTLSGTSLHAPLNFNWFYRDPDVEKR